MNARWRGIDPSLYFITDTALCARAGRSVAETAAAAVRGGAGLVQVRDKQLDDDGFYRLGLAVLDAVAQAAGARRVPVVLNDRIDVAVRLLAEGHRVHVHVGQDDMPVAEVRRRLGPEPLLGLSVATRADIAAARSSGGVDLLGLGPVFATATKHDAGQALGLARVRELVADAALPAVAIGGINLANAGVLRATGIVGICVVSALCPAPDPEARARALYRAFHGDPA